MRRFVVLAFVFYGVVVFADPNDGLRLDIQLALSTSLVQGPPRLSDEDTMNDVVTKVYTKLVRERFCTQGRFESTQHVRICNAELQQMIRAGIQTCSMAVTNQTNAACQAGTAAFKDLGSLAAAERRCEQSTSALYTDFCIAGAKKAAGNKTPNAVRSSAPARPTR